MAAPDGSPSIAFHEAFADSEGRSQRRSLLTAAFDDTLQCLDDVPKKWSVDAIDALALTWTAQRVISNTAMHLGGHPDLLGRPMQLTI